MTGGLLYLDSSALVKLVLPEAETDALRQLLADGKQCVSSALAVVEVTRAARRASTSELVRRRAGKVLEAIDVMRIDPSVIELAADLPGQNLRSLDAIHLASALLLQPDLGALVAYDLRLIEAAEQRQITVLTPR